MAEVEKQFDINCEVPSIPWPARSIFHVGQGRLFLFALPLFGRVGVGIWEPPGKYLRRFGWASLPRHLLQVFLNLTVADAVVA